ncbi:MAG: sigma-70 family RNA polymerase sigma factor [Sedimentisphaerales bacterium]|nr:sigma-70 family RNA polymerase sigma factor [Sedimentisphaerales bacterium]
MVYRDRTDMGGEREHFLTTHWSLIEDAKEHQDRDRALIGLLLERYWKPVYCYVRRKGHDNEQAKDLTQGFFHEVVLGRSLIERADPAKGRFRTFLLHALNQYLLDERRRETAQKRIPQAKLVSLDAGQPPMLPQKVSELGPEQCFDYAWKAELLERALSELKQWYVGRGMDIHWELFRDRLLHPSLEGLEAPSLAQLCQQYGIENETKASNMLGTVKRQFQSILTRHVRQTVLSGEAAEEELGDMFRFLKKESRP